MFVNYHKNERIEQNGSDLRPSRVLMPILSLLLLLSILPVISFDPREVDYLAGGLSNLVYRSNLLGSWGARVGWNFLLTFGLAGYPIALLLCVSSLRRLIWRKGVQPVSWEYVLAFPLFALGISMFLGLWPGVMARCADALNLHTLPGGVLGERLTSPSGCLTVCMNGVVSTLLSLMIMIGSLVIIWYFDWNGLSFATSLNKGNEGGVPESQGEPLPETGEAESLELESPTQPREAALSSPHPSGVLSPKRAAAPAAVSPRKDGKYDYPSIKLLDDKDTSSSIGANAKEIEKNTSLLQKTFDEFNLEASVTNAIPGPQVTLFEISPGAAVKLNKFTSLEPNLKMVLSAKSLRILAPIPGKDKVGIEIPNINRSVVTVHSMMKDKAWTQGREQIPLLLGKNIKGESVILDLAKAPHLLIAGTTGSGKSVCMNLLITSMLFRFSPEELRLVMVDPKVVEFAVYANLPHLVAPVINDVNKVALALRWAINEMERRYRILAKAGVRDLASYNKRPPMDPNNPILDEFGEPIPEKLPYIVIIIDELADIMSVARVEVEKSLQRIAAKSRAVGIHSIIATQRPDVKVITGTIKANYPVRIAFKVASQTDSQTIIGGKGAESLLGYGDMLFQPPGANGLERIQCGMASDEERNKVVEFCASQAEQHFDDSVIRTLEENDADGEADDGENSFPDFVPADGGGQGGNSGKKLLDQAIEIVLRDKQPSISYLQRRLGIGYNKAASLIEELEQKGIIGPKVGNAPREILVTAPPDDEA